MSDESAAHRKDDWTSRLCALEAALFLMVADRAIHFIGFSRLVKTLQARGSRIADRAVVTRIVAALDRRGDVVRYSCLRRGFAAAWMLQWRGYRPVLHYGVRQEDGTMRAHVWVEVASLPVVGYDQSRDYALLASFPDGGA